MLKNTAGQFVGVQMLTAADGTVFTGAVTCNYTIDAGTQTAGATVTHEGNGYHSMPVSAALSNGDHVAYTFTGTGAIAATVQVYPKPLALTAAQVNAECDTALTDYDGPTNTEMIARTITAATYATAANLATVDTNVDSILVDTGTTLPASIADVPTVAEFNARTLLAASYFDPATDTVANVTTVATTTTNTDMVGTDGANTVVPPTVAQFNARTLLAASYFDPAADTVANVTTVATTTTNTDMVSAAPTVTAITADIDANSAQIGAGAILNLSQLVINNIGSGDNISLTGSGVGNGIGFSRSGAGDAWDSNFIGEINATVDTALSDYDGPTNAEMEARTLVAASYFDPAVDAVANVTLVATTTTNTDMVAAPIAASVIADAVWDEAQAGHVTAGTFGLYLDSEVSGATAPTAVQVRQEMDSNSTQLAAIIVDTGTDIPARFDGVEGATFATGTDSLEALRNRGDAAWTTGAGGTPPQLLQDTTIATLASQVSFTLTAGSTDDDAYNGAVAVIEDSATAVQKAVGSISDYVGSTKTITLTADPAIFTMAAGDNIKIIANVSGTAPTAAAVADAVWDEALSGHAVAGSTGKAVTDIETDATAILADTGELQTNQGNWLTATGFATTAEIADVPTVAEFNARTLVAASYFDPAADAVANVTLVATTTTNTDMVGAAPSAAVVADAVWDEAQSGHVTAGTFGLYLDQAVSTGSAPTVAQIRAEMDSNSTQLAAIVADTGELQTNQGNWLTITGHATEAKQDILDTNVDAILVDTGTTIPATIATVDSNVDAILVDTGTTLPGLINTVDTNVDGIKAKTDSLTFTTAGEVDANIQSVNDVVVTGDGGSGTEWGPV